MSSVHHRGTPDRPGLVLALDREDGAACEGVVMWIHDASWLQVMTEIRRRELVTSAYRESVVRVDLRDGGQVDAITYVVDKSHSQFCSGLSPEVQAGIIAVASGVSGDNLDYLRNSVRRLAELGIRDDALVEIERLALNSVPG